MKKKLVFFFLSTFFLVALSIDYQPQVIENTPDAYTVFKYMDNEIDNYPNDFNDFYLLFDHFKLDSKNFVNVLSFFSNFNYQIMEVYPYINPLHQSVLKDITKMEYKYNSLEMGIAGIYDRYMKELEYYRLSDEIDKAYVNGLRIRMIKIKVNNEVLSDFINKHNGIKYSLTPSGLFNEY